MAFHSYRHSDAQTARSIVPSMSGVGLTGLVKLSYVWAGVQDLAFRVGSVGMRVLLLSRFCHVLWPLGILDCVRLHGVALFFEYSTPHLRS